MTPLPPPAHVDACPLCGAPVPGSSERCPDCNMTLAGIGPRPAAFDRRSFGLWAVSLVVIYLVVLAIVVAAR